MELIGERVNLKVDQKKLSNLNNREEKDILKMSNVSGRCGIITKALVRESPRKTRE